MNVFHRYLLARYLRNLALCLAVMLAVVLPLDLLAAGGHGIDTARWRAVTDLLSNVLPLALMVATLFTVGDLTRYQELTALEAAGWSTLRSLWPLVAVAAAASVAMLVLQIATLPEFRGDTASRTERHADLARPFLGFFMVLTAIPLASTKRRATIQTGFIAAMMLVTMDYLIMATAQAFGRYGRIPPIAAGWAGPIVALLCFAAIWRRARL